MARQTLESWINEALTDDTKSEKCNVMTLVHVKGMSQVEVCSIPFGGARNWTAKDLAATFRHKAEGYSQDMPGIQTFCLLAFYGQEEPGARHPFRITVSDGTSETLGTEAPTKMGMVQQAMRQAENLHQMMIQSTKMVLEANRQTMQTLVEQNQHLMTENADAFAIVKQLLGEKMSAEHNKEMERLTYERQTVERTQLLKMLPGFVNTLTGKELIPSSQADSEIIEMLAETMTEEQAGQLFSILTPAQAGLVAPRMQQILEQRRKANEGAAEVLTKNPEDDAAGD